MTIRIREFSTLREAEHFFRGGVTGNKIDLQKGLVYNLHNRTLIINATTVTFDETSGAAGLGGGLTLQEIKGQITDALATVIPTFIDGRLGLVETTPSAGITIDAAGTSNPIFGFSGSTDTVGTVRSGPDIVSFIPKATNDGYAAVIEE